MNDGKFCKHVWYNNVYNNLIIYSVLNIIQEIFASLWEMDEMEDYSKFMRFWGKEI